MRAAIALSLFVAGWSVAAGDSLPKSVTGFLGNYCLDCHDADTKKGDLNLDLTSVDWNSHHSAILWTRVYDALQADEMPPKKKRHQPTANERQTMVSWLNEKLGQHNRPGGTVLRRLNRSEYENSVRVALGAPFSVPNGFPGDPEFHGFDNVGEGLVLSPPLLQKYFELAGAAADLVIPPAKGKLKVKPETTELDPGDLSMAFEGIKLQDATMRLVTRNEVLIRSCSWPTRFEAPYTGTYLLKSRLSAFKPKDGKPFRVELLVIKSSMTFTDIRGLKRAATLQVPADGEVHELTAEFDLEKGQTVAFFWANSDFGWSKAAAKTEPVVQIRERFIADPKFHAAWLKLGGFDRGRTAAETWRQMKELMAGDQLDLNDPRIKNPPERMGVRDRNGLTRVISVKRMELGPALDIHGVTFMGPTVLKESGDDGAQRARTARFLGERKERSDEQYARSILQPFLERAFRRPVTDEQLRDYTNIALSHSDAGHRFEDGIHLAVRAALCSTHFLYRGQREGRMDDYDLASRLSYFLTGGPPDSRLYKLAASGRLADSKVLAEETRRMLAHKRSRTFLDTFLGQWLDLDLLPEIMPDTRLIPKWLTSDTQAITEETQLFVAEILRENLPLETFIDPDFTYVNRRNAKLYGMKISGDQMQRVALQRGGRYGGILGQASVMMATANGVDTQPVLRGVWLLENIFGDPPPEPPTGVPAIEPDTSGAETIREQLARHQADPNCAGCHRKIDPPGFALENFDPVGRWREHYPVYGRGPDTRKSQTYVMKNGRKVDSAAELADGTRLKDATDLKRYLVENIDQFAKCLAGKLLTYATGRTPGFGDRNEINRVVAEVKAKGNGFQDLIVELVLSESFRTK